MTEPSPLVEAYKTTDTPFVLLRTDGRRSVERVVRAYVLDAVDRLSDHPGCEGVSFVPNLDGGFVALRIVGDVDDVVATERAVWDDLVDDGLLESWEVEEKAEWNLEDHWADNGAILFTELGLLAARLSKLVYETVEAPLDPVDVYPGEREERGQNLGVGWWTLLDQLTAHQGYSEEEAVDVYAAALRFRLETIARSVDEELAVEKLDEVVDSLETCRDGIGSIEPPGGDVERSS